MSGVEDRCNMDLTSKPLLQAGVSLTTTRPEPLSNERNATSPTLLLLDPFNTQSEFDVGCKSSSLCRFRCKDLRRRVVPYTPGTTLFVNSPNFFYKLVSFWISNFELWRISLIISLGFFHLVFIHDWNPISPSSFVILIFPKSLWFILSSLHPPLLPLSHQPSHLKTILKFTYGLF